jgi:hypothetical protein
LRSAPFDGRAALVRGVVASVARRTSLSAGSVVMATGVVGLALHLDGRGTPASILIGAAAATWLVLALTLLWRALADTRRIADETRGLGALTLVAGSAVLGSGLSALGRHTSAIGLWVVGAVFWCWVLARIALHPPRERDGLWFLPAVATQAMAALSATLALQVEARWPARLAAVLIVAGLALYLVGLARFPLRQLRDGGGEIWIAGGALAVAALACGDLVRAIDALGVMRDLRPAAVGVDVGTWIAAMAWLAVLVAAEARWPRPGYDASRWATAFPVGMYAACSFATGTAAGLGAVTDFARVWVWVALAVWGLTALGLIRRLRAARAGRPDPPGPRDPRPRASG